jgi:hypothetical protein
MMLKTGLVVAAAFGLITAGVVTTPASAQVVEREKYSGTEPFAFTACDGVDVQGVDQFSGTFMLRQHGSAQRAYVVDNFRIDTTYTNMQTNRSWTARTNFTHLDVKIELVSGTVYRYTWQDAGTFKVFDESGKMAYVEAGLRRETALVDTHGNLDLDDDEYLEQLNFQLRGHYSGSDFCTDLEAFTTG